MCVYHVGQKYASDSPGIVGECLATMAFECARYQVDIIAGDGNKACYYTTRKPPGVPTYQHSLIQFWINRIMGVATQAMRKIHDPTCPPIRVKHFISCSYRDLDSLATHLDGITTATYTEEHMKKTEVVRVTVVCFQLLSGVMHIRCMRNSLIYLRMKIT